VVIGCILGDGAMRCKKNALLEINHSAKQKSYVDWKYDSLRRFVATPPKIRRGGYNRVAYRFTTRSLPELTVLYKQFYKDYIKIIPRGLKIKPLSLAIWFMDDGCKSHRAIYLNTQKFDLKSQMQLIRFLEKQFKIKASLNKDKIYYRLRIAVASVQKFKSIVRPYILPQFNYKLPS
ncbi:MAG: hypothetical protein HZA00_00230, partial [Nitrospinae bacterium]|nr:hypothetical protein [Nitrospinota bacterium]